MKNIKNMKPKKITISLIFRSSRTEVFYKKGVLENFAKFTGKPHRPETLTKEETLILGVSF